LSSTPTTYAKFQAHIKKSVQNDHTNLKARPISLRQVHFLNRRPPLYNLCLYV